MLRADELPGKTEFERHLRRSFAADSQPVSTTEIWVGYESFLDRRPDFAAWYAGLFEAANLRVDWKGDAPTIPLDCISDWVLLCNDFDPDALLTFHLAWKGIGIECAQETIERLGGWQSIPRASHHELDVLSKSGLSDMHVHVGGARIPQSVWLDAVVSRRSHTAHTALARAYADIGRDLRADLEAASRARATLATVTRIQTSSLDAF